MSYPARAEGLENRVVCKIHSSHFIWQSVYLIVWLGLSNLLKKIRKVRMKTPRTQLKKCFATHDHSKPHSARIKPGKYSIKSGLVYHIYHIHQTLLQVIFIFFLLYKMILRIIKYLKNVKWKHLWKRSWAQNPLNFTRKELTICLING